MRRAAFLLCVFCVLCCVLHRTNTATHAVQANAGVPQGKWILVELDLKRLTLYEGTTVLKRYPIASGAWDTPSPIGSFMIDGRFMTQMSGFGTRFLSLNVPWGNYGIHGTNKPASIGGNASHGCIRMYVKDAEELYASVPNGTKVYIEGGPYGLLGDGMRTLQMDDRGSHVQLLQQRLRQLGFYDGAADGIYGAATSRAVRAARKAYGLTDADAADQALYTKMGILLFE